MHKTFFFRMRLRQRRTLHYRFIHKIRDKYGPGGYGVPSQDQGFGYPGSEVFRDIWEMANVSLYFLSKKTTFEHSVCPHDRQLKTADVGPCTQPSAQYTSEHRCYFRYALSVERHRSLSFILKMYNRSNYQEPLYIS